MNQVRFETRPEGTETMSPEMMNSTNYYQWTVSQFLPYLGDKVLDIGGGFGAHLEFILPHVQEAMSIELSQYNVDYMNDRFQKYSHFKAIHGDFGKDDIHMLTGQNFNSIILLNVLEHIEDDVQALRDMHTILAPQNGTLCIQVPAHQWLYGSMDEQAGHYRRYAVDEMKRKLTESGFEVVKAYYFNIFGVVPWFISARILKKSLEAGSVNFQIKVFNALIPFLSKFENVLPLPVGQSVMAIATVK